MDAEALGVGRVPEAHPAAAERVLGVAEGDALPARGPVVGAGHELLDLELPLGGAAVHAEADGEDPHGDLPEEGPQLVGPLVHEEAHRLLGNEDGGRPQPVRGGDAVDPQDEAVAGPHAALPLAAHEAVEGVAGTHLVAEEGAGNLAAAEEDLPVEPVQAVLEPGQRERALHGEPPEEAPGLVGPGDPVRGSAPRGVGEGEGRVPRGGGHGPVAEAGRGKGAGEGDGLAGLALPEEAGDLLRLGGGGRGGRAGAPVGEGRRRRGGRGPGGRQGSRRDGALRASPAAGPRRRAPEGPAPPREEPDQEQRGEGASHGRSSEGRRSGMEVRRERNSHSTYRVRGPVPGEVVSQSPAEETKGAAPGGAAPALRRHAVGRWSANPCRREASTGVVRNSLQQGLSSPTRQCGTLISLIGSGDSWASRTGQR